MERKKIVITGGLGHIGSHLVHRTSLTTYHDITIIDNLSTQRYCSLIGLMPFVKFIEADFHTRPDVIRNADIIIHLAAHNEALKSENCKEEFLKNNVQNLERLIDQLSDRHVFVFPSSTSIYG